MLLRAFNAGLRLSSLGMKMVLTLYMGRYLSLEDIGTYGLVAAYVALVMAVIGARFDYLILRDIVDRTVQDTARLLYQQALFFGFNYLLLIVLGAIFYASPYNHLDAGLFILVIILSIGESFATVNSGSLNSLRQPIQSNILFFIRAAAWVLPVVGLGMVVPELRTAEFIFFCWLSGIVLSLLANVWLWRHLPWRQVLHQPFDQAYLKRGLRICVPIWLGTVGMTAATYADRFVIEYYLGRDYVGVISFYSSFIMAVSSVLASGIFAFTYPHLVVLYRQGETVKFRQEAIRMTWHSMISAALMVLVIGWGVPFLGGVLGRPEFVTHAPVLWLMLAGVWLRSASEGAYYVLYAREQDRAVWLGHILYMLVTVITGIILAPITGLSSVGYATLAGAAFLGLWRIYFVWRWKN